MPENSAATSVVEDITEVTWEDLIVDMVGDDSPDIHTGSSSTGGSIATCVTTFTSTGSCVHEAPRPGDKAHRPVPRAPAARHWA